jgi:hypothetical protein
MAENTPDYATWLPVIGRSLAFLCLQGARKNEPTRYKEVLEKVDFLEGLGLPAKDAAEAAGSTAESVRVAKFNRKKAKAKKSGKKSKARGRTR